MRLEQEVNIYGDAEILKRFQAAETSISVVQGNISALISESELIELQNSHTTMYSQMASLKLDVDDLELSFSDLQTKYNTVTGQYTELSSKVAEYKAGVDGLSADITAVEQNLSKNYSTTSVMDAAIAAKADEITASVSNTYATKTALNNANSEIDALQSWKNEASLKITDSAIVATVTSSSSWATKADKANLIAQINLSSESASISASKINLNGVVTANENFKILSDGSMEAKAATISGKVTATALNVGDYLKYDPHGWSTPYGIVYFSAGGWQIKTTYDYHGYDVVTYWDTPDTQENGICAHGPWVIWGGWNGEASLDYVNNYKFVVSDKGDVYGQRFYDNGQQLLPIVTQNMHVSLTSNWCSISKSGYFLLSCSLIRADSGVWVTGTQRQTNGSYIILLENANGGEVDLYTVWCKNPD
ncbi:MAG: hypothetical protein KHZ73_00540 [Lachnospiraceae bacterium]|nr:hypothetical protein [Lachnospiraceae bacterium]